MNAQQQPHTPVNRPRRGASRAGERVPGILATHRWLVPLLFVALICAAVEMGVSAFGEVANVPIRQVSVNGDFRFLDKARIEKSMLPHLGTGFFMVNPPGSEKLLLEAFDRYTEILEPAGVRIASIVLDGKHACRITLTNDTEVLLGRREIDHKVQLLSRLLQTTWAGQRDRLARIDMRYSNGVAVAWRDAAPTPVAAR